MNPANKIDFPTRSTPTADLRVAFVQACWHKEIVDRCREGFLETTEALGISRPAIELHEVPGAFELPLYVKTLALTGNYDAVVAAGLVVDGGIYRHDFVAQAVIQGLMQVQLETGTPVFSAVLTPHNFQPCAEHIGFFSDHFVAKGREVANTCVSTVQKIQCLKILETRPSSNERAPGWLPMGISHIGAACPSAAQ